MASTVVVVLRVDQGDYGHYLMHHLSISMQVLTLEYTRSDA